MTMVLESQMYFRCLHALGTVVYIYIYHMYSFDLISHKFYQWIMCT